MLDAKHCEHCGKAFVPVDPDEGFCSEWCLRAHDRERSTVVITLTGNEYRRAADMSLVKPSNTLVNGSPAFAVNGRPVAWYESWIRDDSLWRAVRRDRS